MGVLIATRKGGAVIDAVAAREKYLRLRGLEPVPELADAVARDDYLPVLDALADAQAKIAELEAGLMSLVDAVEQLNLAHGENCWDGAPINATADFCGCGLNRLDTVTKRILRDFFDSVGAPARAAARSARSIPDPE